jgi:uncharacterized membrane protein
MCEREALCASRSCVTQGASDSQPYDLRSRAVEVLLMFNFTLGFIAGAIGPGTLVVGFLLAMSLAEHVISWFNRRTLMYGKNRETFASGRTKSQVS